MATTVEEILVKFTGDASGLANATSQNTAKIRTMEGEVARLEARLKITNQASLRFGNDTRNLEKFKRLIEEARKHQELLNAAMAKGVPSAPSSPKGNVGGSGEGHYRDGGMSGGREMMNRFGNNIKSQVISTAINAISAAFQRAAEDIGGYTAAMREMNKVDYESSQIQMKRVRQIGDKDAMFEQKLGLMVDPETGRQKIEGQKKALQDEILAGQKRKQEADANVRRAEKELEEFEDSRASLVGGVPSALTKGQAAQIPGLGMGEAKEIELKKKAVEEARELARVEEAAIHKKIQQQKILNGGKSNLDLTKDQISARNYQLNAQKDTVGLSQEEVQLQQTKLQLAKDLTEQGIKGAEQQKKIAEFTKETVRLNEELKFKREEDAKAKADEAKEEAEQMASVKRIETDRFRAAGRGFGGVEAEVLGRNSEGKQLGNIERLKAGYEEEAHAINQKFLPATVKAQMEIERLNMLREKGLLNQDAYDKAILEQVKTMDPGGRAASRAATVTGSAEDFARRDEYSRMMEQPKADSAAVDRAMKESSNNPVVKAFKEGISILVQTIKGQGKEGQIIKPANVEN